MKQLSSQSLTAFLPVVREYENREQTGFSSGSLDLTKCQELMIELVMLYPHTTIIIDALDECDLATRGHLLQVLREICIACPGLVSIFVSSRNDDDLVLELEGVPNHYISLTDNAADIETFVEVKISRAIQDRKLLRGKVSEHLKALIITAVSKGAKGMLVRFLKYHYSY